MLMKATKFSKHNCYFLTFFCPADNPVAHYLILLCAKRTGVVPGKQKISVSHRAVCRQLKAQRVIRLLILTRFPCSEKGNTLFTDPKNRQVKIIWFLVAQRNQNLSFKYVQFNLRSKSNCPVSNTFMPLLALSTMSLPSVQTITKEDEVVMRDWIDNFRLVRQRTIRSESSQDKAGSLPPASRDYVILFAIFLKS